MTEAALSEVSNGAKWNPDPSFSVADALLADPEFASVLKIVLRRGHVLVSALEEKKRPTPLSVLFLPRHRQNSDPHARPRPIYTAGFCTHPTHPSTWADYATRL